jgi:hypothetical protein
MDGTIQILQDLLSAKQEVSFEIPTEAIFCYNGGEEGDVAEAYGVKGL